jgi:alkylhydroperoxidase family enzyme
MARITYATPDDLPAEKRSLLDTLSESAGSDAVVDHSLEGGTLNVYRAMGRNLDLLEGFRNYGSAVWTASGLAPHERELVILATCHTAGNEYEWHQHVRVALDEGMAPETILAVSMERPEELDDRHAVLVDYVRHFVAGDVDDALHDRLASFYDEPTIVGIDMLAGLYLGLARVIDALAVETEVPFVGWELENL